MSSQTPENVHHKLWRVSDTSAVRVYEGERPIATFDRAEDAQRVVAIHNASISRQDAQANA